MQEDSHPVLAPGNNGEYNGGSVDAVSHQMEGQIMGVLWFAPYGDDVSYGHFVPVFIFVDGHAEEAFGVGFFVDGVGGERVQVEEGEVVQILTSLWCISLIDLTATDSELTFCAFSDRITLNPARPAAESGNEGATEQIMTLA